MTATLSIRKRDGRVFKVLVDAADLERIGASGWCVSDPGKDGRTLYVKRKKPGTRTTEFLHRVIMAAPKGIQVDHVDGNGLDNRRANLRLAEASQNMYNRGKLCTNTSGFKGVSLHKQTGRWCARIRLPGARAAKHLGLFDTKEAAHAAYCTAAEAHGEFRRTV